MKRQPKRKILAALLAAALLLGQTFPAMAVTNDEGPPCENHQQHDADCGYVEGSPCGHTEHTADCYTDELICGLDGDAVQTATDSEADEPHEHTQECYALDCPHERREHDNDCGYAEARPCTHECELCATKDSGTPPDTSGQNVQKSTPSEAAPAMVAAPVPNSTIDGTGYSFNPDDGKLTVSSSNGTTTWRNSSYIDKTAVTSVVVTDKVNTIGMSAFEGCTNLAQAELPSTVTSIGDRAFYGCVNLALTSLPDNLTSIGESAFFDCSKLALTSLPDSLTSIGVGAFSGCRNLALTALPDSVTSIGAGAFYGCVNLALTALPDSVTSIGNEAFFSCRNLALTALPDNLTSIGVGAFSGCSKLELKVLPDKLTSIGDRAFSSCVNLALTALPDNLTSIGNEAFEYCRNLALTALPASVTSIGSSAFSGCSNLALTALPDKLTSIGQYTFYECNNLALTSLPDNVTSIGEYAFAYCSKLELTALPDSLTSIGYDAFYGCNNLALTSLPNNLTSIGNEAFSGCTSLESLDLSGCTSLTSIGFEAFEGCTGLESLDLSGCTNLKEIGALAFEGCTSLTSLILSNDPAPTLGVEAFVDTAPGLAIFVPKDASGYTSDNNWLVDKVVDGAALSGLEISEGTLDPAFFPGTNAYTVSIPYTVENVTFTPTAHANGAITVNGSAVTSGSPSAEITLTLGETKSIPIVVENSNTDRRTYTISVTRAHLTAISIEAIPGVTPPALGAAPVTVITETAEYTGTVKWNPDPGAAFAADTEYTATITLSPKPGYTLQGVAANFFKVNGATSVSNAENSGIITASFPGTSINPVYSIRANTAALDFGAITANDAPPAEKTVTVENTGNQSVTLTQPTATSYDVGALSKTTLAPGETANFTVRPQAGLSVGSYSRTMTITPDHGAAVEVELFFTVTDKPTYTMTVTGGTGGGSYEAGAAVTITATVPSDKRFSGWTITPDVAFTSGGTNTETATFTMPAGAVTATANFENKQSSGGGGGSSGSSYYFRTLTDKASGVKVEGRQIHEYAALTVKAGGLHNAGDAGCDLLRTADKAGRVLSLYDVSLSRVFRGSVTVSIPVEGRDGQTLTVAHCIGGKLTLSNVTVKNGMAAVTAEELSPFAVLDGVYTLDTLAAPAVGNPFADVKESDWYYNAVLYAYQNGLMNGTTSTTFDPLGAVTRAQPPVVLYRLEGSPAVTAQNPFADVRPGLWYANGITWAAGTGLVDGYNATTYGPGDAVTREQLAVMLWRYAKYKGWDVSMGEDTNILSYADAFDVSEWAIPALQWACGAGIMTGNTDNRLAPKAGATRAELAQMLQRLMEKYQQPAAPVNPSTGASKARRVRVQKGDTLSGLARKYNSTVEAIVQANSIIKNPGFILPGWELDIP